MHLLREYNKKYLGYADYDPSAATLSPQLAWLSALPPQFAIILLIVDVLLQKGCMDPLLVSKQLLADPGRFTSYPGAVT
jgi:hypothetical protein